MIATVPVGTSRIEWTCKPPQNPMCHAIATAQAVPNAPGTYALPAIRVHGAASALRSQTSNTSVNVEVIATAYNAHDEGFARGIRTLVLQFVGQIHLLPVAGVREYTPLDDGVRLEVSVERCLGSAMGDGYVQWSWRRQNASQAEATLIGRGVTYTSLLLPVSRLPGPGMYVFQAALPGTTPLATATFDVEIKGLPPPVARLAAPVSGSPDCNLILDASASTDPSGASLTYSWSCGTSATNVCSALANRTTTSTFTIEGGSLGAGSYKFTVRVARGTFFF